MFFFLGHFALGPITLLTSREYTAEKKLAPPRKIVFRKNSSGKKNWLFMEPLEVTKNNQQSKWKRIPLTKRMTI
jgi:hypothetical protein